VSPGVRERLLREAEALVYISLFEGFGLPPLEAMIRSTPALVSDRASLPEVTGGCAPAVDPLDVGAISDALVRLVDQGLDQDALERARLQACSYSVERAGAAITGALAATAAVAGRAVPR
jgi:glycosyltransferase involved in cell wall biosynthesis